MYKFAEYLTDYMKRNNISCRKAAIAINIDRTQFRRYVIGERLPKNETIVESIARGIDMSEEETHLLFKYYKRSRMGEQKYSWYKLIGKILDGKILQNTEMISKTDQLTDKDIPKIIPDEMMRSAPHIDDSNVLENLINITKDEQINRMIRFVCNDAKYVRIMFQTRIYSYYDSICEAIRHNKDCVIESIVELNNINSADDVSDIKIFQKIYQLIVCGRSCKVYYTYNDYNTTMTNNFIISDKGLLVFHTFEDCVREPVGIYADKKDIYTYYMNKFLKLKEKSYIYGYSEETDIKKDYNIKRILENQTLDLIIGIYKKDNRNGLWISGNRRQGRRDMYIEEENIIYNFSLYAKEYYNVSQEDMILV